MNYRTILVDDEEKALERMEKLCRRNSQVEVVGVFSKPLDALDFIRSNPVDLALLDIEMPKMSGLELADSIQEFQPNIDVVFVTAFDKYALEAFQVNAVGYLLKPIDSEDLDQQLNQLSKKKQLRSVPYNRSKIKVQCMGGFSVFKNRDKQEPIKWRTAKAEELLALLIHSRGQWITKDRIIDILWPEMDYDKASKNLHAISYYIRDALQGFGYEDVFMRSKGQYQLKMDRLEIDAVLIEELMSYVPIRAIPEEKISEVLKLAKGRYFEGKDYGWAVSTDIWIQNKVDELALIQAERFIASGDATAAIDALMNTIKRNSCHEEAFKMIIQVYLKQGNQKAARQWYKTYETNLREELDDEPVEEIKKLVR